MKGHLSDLNGACLIGPKKFIFFYWYTFRENNMAFSCSLAFSLGERILWETGQNHKSYKELIDTNPELYENTSLSL